MLAALEAVNLDLPLKTKVYTMSGGEKQRLALARLKLRDSRLILADEPTGSLDAENKTIIIQLLRSFADQGKAVLVVTHDPDFLEVADSRMELN